MFDVKKYYNIKYYNNFPGLQIYFCKRKPELSTAHILVCHKNQCREQILILVQTFLFYISSRCRRIFGPYHFLEHLTSIPTFTNKLCQRHHFLPFLTLLEDTMFIFPTVPKSIPCRVDVFKAGIMGRSSSWKHMFHQPFGLRLCTCG